MVAKNPARAAEARKVKVQRIPSGGRVVTYRGTRPEALRYAAYLSGKIPPHKVRDPR